MQGKYNDVGEFLHVDKDMEVVGEVSLQSAFGISLPDDHPLSNLKFTYYKDK